jgi:hypothetical protein
MDARHLRRKLANIVARKAEADMQDDKTDPWGLESAGVTKSRLRQVKSSSRFDPYQGAIPVKPPSRKRDLRKIEEWLKAKRRAEQLKVETESGDED